MSYAQILLRLPSASALSAVYFGSAGASSAQAQAIITPITAPNDVFSHPALIENAPKKPAQSVPIASTLSIAGTTQRADNMLFPSSFGALFRDDVAGTRVQPAFAPVGIATHALLIYPTLTAGSSYDTNVLNRPQFERGDLNFTLSPAVSVRTDWGRNEIDFDARLLPTRYVSVTSENSVQYSAEARGRYDVSATNHIGANLSYAREVEPRGLGGSSVFNNAQPSTFYELHAQLGDYGEFANIKFAVTGTIDRRTYNDVRQNDGTEFSQRFRNVIEASISPRVDYAFSQNASVFAEGRAYHVDSLRPPPCCDRSGNGRRILAGVHVGSVGQLVGEVAAGYQGRDFKNTLYPNYKGFVYRGTIDWYPTSLLSFRATTDQDFEDSGLTQVAAILARTTALINYYEVERNVLITTTAQYINENYREIGLTANTKSLNIAIQYSFNHQWAATINSGYRSKSVDDRQISAKNQIIVNHYQGFTLSANISRRF